MQPRPWSLGALPAPSSARPRAAATSSPAHGTHVVGFAGLMLVVDDGHVTNVAVAPSTSTGGPSPRGSCCGSAATAARAGRQELTLEVRMCNRGAQALYSRFGFAPAGVRKAYYADNREDAVIMWAHRHRPAAPSLRIERAGPGIEASLPTPTVLQGVHPAAAGGRAMSDRPRRAGARRRRRRRSSASRPRATRPPPRSSVGGRPGAARRSCPARSTSTPATAGSCRRSPAGPTSSCSRR